MRESRAGPKGPFIVDKTAEREDKTCEHRAYSSVNQYHICIRGIIFGLRNNKRADVTEIERKATETATINVKLDQIY